MSWAEARAVRKSNLYEYAGIAKSLLERIALLIIHVKDGEPPDPNDGWCVASQEVLAAMQGCSEKQVNRHIATYERDGWITVKRFRDSNGHEHCHYQITPTQIKRVQEHEMKKDENGDYIRGCMASRRRRTTLNPGDKLSASRKTSCLSADGHLVSQQGDNLSAKTLRKPSFVEGQTLQADVPASDPDVLRTPKEGTKAPHPPVGGYQNSRGSAPRPKWLLDDGPAEELRRKGCPENVLVTIAARSGWSDALNNTSNVIASYITMATSGRNEAIRKAWMPGLSLSMAEHRCTCADPEFCNCD